MYKTFIKGKKQQSQLRIFLNFVETHAPGGEPYVEKTECLHSESRTFTVDFKRSKSRCCLKQKLTKERNYFLTCLEERIRFYSLVFGYGLISILRFGKERHLVLLQILPSFHSSISFHGLSPRSISNVPEERHVTTSLN